MRNTRIVAAGLLAILGSCTGVGVLAPDPLTGSGVEVSGEAVAATSSATPTFFEVQAPKVVALRTKTIGFRGGPFYPSDSSLADLDNSIGRYGFEFSHRNGGPDGHLSVTGGIEWWRAKGSTVVGATRRDVELDQWVFPVSVFYNTASLVEWSRGKLNLYGGGGAQLNSVYQQSYTALGIPVYSYEGGWGLQLEGGVQLPLGKMLYLQGFARYEWSWPWDSNSLAAGIDELGGAYAGIEIGLRL